MTYSFESLPSEILGVIATFCVELDDDGEDALFCLPSTSRAVQAATRQTWLSLYFRRRTVILSPTNLAQLKEVTATEEFARHVKAICVYSEDDRQILQLSDTTEEDDLGSLAKSLKLGILLGLALQNLKNLTDVAFKPYDTSANTDDAPTYSGVDFSATFNIVLLALQTNALRPERVAIFELDSPGFSITQCSAMLELTDCLAK